MELCRGGGIFFEITAVENNPEVAEIYADLYPKDNVIVADAHEYLRKHFRNFDFIWASPPCPTHSVLQMTRFYSEKLKFPDMTLYQEIIWLQKFYKGAWVVENVKPYYIPLIPPTFSIGRHYFWSSEKIDISMFQEKIKYTKIRDNIKKMANMYGFDINKLKTIDKRKALRNCVHPEIGKYIFNKFMERRPNKI